MKKWIIGFLIFLLILGGGFYLYHRTQKKAPAQFVLVKKGTVVEKAQAVGYILPEHSITVKSQINGVVAEIYHYEGDFVKKGEPLIKVDPAPSPAEYATAFQDVQSTKAVMLSSEKDLKRFLTAKKTGLISNQYAAFIAAKKSVETSKSAYALALQKLALLEQGKTIVGGKTIANIVESPVTGYILNRNVDVGDPVISISSAQSATPLFSMANMTHLMFQGVVDELDASKIQLNMQVEITVGAFPNAKIKGKLSRISLQSDRENKLQGISDLDVDSPFNVGFKVEIGDLTIPKNIELRSGFSASADIMIKKAKDVLTLPERVIYFNNDNEPYVLVPTTKGSKEVSIKIGLSDGMNVEITSGLKEGEKVLDIPLDADNDQTSSRHRKKQFSSKK